MNLIFNITLALAISIFFGFTVAWWVGLLYFLILPFQLITRFAGFWVVDKLGIHGIMYQSKHYNFLIGVVQEFVGGLYLLGIIVLLWTVTQDWICCMIALAGYFAVYFSYYVSNPISEFFRRLAKRKEEKR